MRRIWTVSGAGIALFVTACSSEPVSNRAERDRGTNTSAPANDHAANDAVPAAKVALAPDGLLLGGTQALEFGATTDSVIGAVGGALGAEAKRNENSECAAGPLALAQYPGGLTLFFQDSKFVGWDVDGREKGRFPAPDGLAIGTTRAELQARGDLQMQASTVGAEFSFGGISGLLASKDQNARVTNLWAGTTCIFR